MLGGICLLEEKDSFRLQKALELARKKFEADAFDRNESRVAQVRDCWTLGPFVEEGQLQRANAYLPVLSTDNGIEWIFIHATGERVHLGQEGFLTETGLRMLDKFMAARVKDEICHEADR